MDDQEYRPEIEDVMDKISESRTDKIAAALAKAQSEMSNAPMNRVNPHFKSKYADLASIRDAVIPALTKHGIALVQTTIMPRDRRGSTGSFILVTTLLHSSGQYIESAYPLPMTVDRPQQLGSALTYARRYSIAAICGISAEEDDDANAAQDAATAQEKTSTGRPTPDAVVKKREMEKVAAPPKKPWTGPQPVTELKANLKAFGAALAECQTEKDIEDLYFGDEYRQTFDQAKEDLPDWMARAEAAVNERMNQMLEKSDA